MDDDIRDILRRRVEVQKRTVGVAVCAAPAPPVPCGRGFLPTRMPVTVAAS
jgi:hypothetical protein